MHLSIFPSSICAAGINLWIALTVLKAFQFLLLFHVGTYCSRSWLWHSKRLLKDTDHATFPKQQVWSVQCVAFEIHCWWCCKRHYLGESREPWEMFKEDHRSRSTREGNLQLNLPQKNPWTNLFHWEHDFCQVSEVVSLKFTPSQLSEHVHSAVAPLIVVYGLFPKLTAISLLIYFHIFFCFQRKYNFGVLGWWDLYLV